MSEYDVEASRCSATQEIPSLLWKVTFHNCLHKKLDGSRPFPLRVSLRCTVIFPSHLCLGMASDLFLPDLRTETLCIVVPSHACCIQCSSHQPSLEYSNLYLAKNTSNKAPHYAIFSNLLLLHPFWVQIFSSAPASQTPSVYALFHFLQPYKTTGKITLFL